MPDTLQYPLERQREVQRKWLQRYVRTGALPVEPLPQTDPAKAIDAVPLATDGRDRCQHE